MCQYFKQPKSQSISSISVQLTSINLVSSYRLVTRPGARDVEGVDPIMGVYLGLRIPGIVKEGDPIYVGYD